MNQIKNFTRKFIKWGLKFLLFAIVITLLLLATITISLQFPSVQTKVVNKATEYLSKSLNFPIHIKSVDIDWFDEIVLEGVSVLDPRKGKMIYLEEAIVDFEIISLYTAKFNIDEITLRNGRVNVIKYAPDGMLNITEFIDAIRELTTPKTPSKKPIPFTIASVILDNMSFKYSDQRKPTIQNGFDHNHFECDSIYANITDLKAVADTFQIDIHKLKTFEVNTKLRVHEINTLFTLTKGDMTFDNLYAHIGQSTIKDYLRFNYKNINDLSDFNEKIDVIALLNESKINFDNLSNFAPDLKRFKENITVSGLFNGTVTNFKVKDLDLAFGKSSYIKGKVSFNGLPEWEETFIEFSFANTFINANDLKQYFDNNTYIILKKFGHIAGKGNFIGFPQDFVTKGSFNTALGGLSSDIRLEAKDESSPPKYSGRLKTFAFNLGQLIDEPQKVQLLDMNGSINGSGLSLETASATINASISRIGINNYNYRNIKTNAKLSNNEFNGYINIKDTNLVLVANGKIDLTKNKEVFDISANLKKANLKALHLSDIETLIQTDVSLNFTGTQIDNIIGNATFKNTHLIYKKDKEIFIDSLLITSIKNDQFRIFEIKSNLLSLKASGDFAFTTVSKDIERLYKEYKLNIINNKIELTNYYSNKNIPIQKYSLEFNLEIKNLNSLFEMYAPGLYLSQGVSIQGDFTNSHNSVLNINTHIDTLYYKENEFFNTDIELSTSKLADSSNVLAVLFIQSEKQKVYNVPKTKNFFFEGIWDKRSIDFSTSIFQQNSTNNLDLNGNISFIENKKIIRLNNSSLNILNKIWNIAPNNEIHLSQSDIYFNNFTLGNNNQLISLDGTISKNRNEVAQLKIANFDLENINSFSSGYKFNGITNGKILIKDIYKDLDLEGNLNINNFSIDGFLIGNIISNSTWDNRQNQLNLSLEVERSNAVTISMDGYIKPKTETTKEEINITARLDNADIEILSPIVKGVFSDLSGKATGDFKIAGTLKDPSITGKGKVSNGKLKIDYLGTTYFFDDYIYLEENLIGVKNLKLKDEFGNTGIINGGISHDGFKKFIVDVRGNLNQLNVLNTTEKNNDQFYGTAFVTGNFEILGPFSNLIINANATSKKGTKIFIPLNSYEGLEQQSFITFKSRKNISKTDEDTNEVDLSGIKMDLNFELTPDAYAEIIFDKRAGDIIRGYGNGNIKMTIDTRGDFNMYGNYIITRGSYNYTLAGLISKEFTIEPNSSVSWSGDPYGGILDVKAYYENRVSVYPLDTTNKDEQLRTHPVKVILDMEGNLMSPHISLDIDITPTTGEATVVATKFESDIKRNEQELNRQVFSLLILGGFAGNNFTGIGGSESNVSQLLTNQLGNWLSQVDENLIVDIDLNGLDKEALNTFNLRLSYTLLEGRLRISRDGNFSNFQNSNSQQNQNLSSIAGEWTIEYLLSKDGKFRLKLYNKNNQNSLLNTLNTSNSTSAGFSIIHTQSFSSIGDLLGKKKKEKSSPNLPPTDIALPRKEDNP